MTCSDDQSAPQSWQKLLLKVDKAVSAPEPAKSAYLVSQLLTILSPESCTSSNLKSLLQNLRVLFLCSSDLGRWKFSRY
eukprot:3870142-Amphidinium_carterae.1